MPFPWLSVGLPLSSRDQGRSSWGAGLSLHHRSFAEDVFFYVPFWCRAAGRLRPALPPVNVAADPDLTGSAAAVPLPGLLSWGSGAADEVSQVSLPGSGSRGKISTAMPGLSSLQLKAYLAPTPGTCEVSLGRGADKEHIPAWRCKLHAEWESEPELRKVWGFILAPAVGKAVKSPEPW